ncbi:hypothetical protein [Pseudoduganella sp. UC29_71]|uniref:hypothetical protein n=1 Tax=Pseudoduganella sp. UC29_71 TaxID=3350174 RepID=UPI00366B4CDB
MTNLLDETEFPEAEFGDLYHQRWRKKKHLSGLARTLEHVSSLSQLAAMHDFAAKILCDNLQVVVTAAAYTAVPAVHLAYGRREKFHACSGMDGIVLAILRLRCDRRGRCGGRYLGHEACMGERPQPVGALCALGKSGQLVIERRIISAIQFKVDAQALTHRRRSRLR